VLELCPHGDIFTLMKNVNKKLELAKKKRKIMIYYLAQILEVLDYLHAQQIVHRDLKVTSPPLSLKILC
jgi:serine/threonine protein kinase